MISLEGRDDENAAECPAQWAGVNAAVLIFTRQDIPVLHFRRGWKASTIREAPPCGRGASLSCCRLRCLRGYSSFPDSFEIAQAVVIFP